MTRRVSGIYVKHTFGNFPPVFIAVNHCLRLHPHACHLCRPAAPSRQAGRAVQCEQRLCPVTTRIAGRTCGGLARLSFRRLPPFPFKVCRERYTMPLEYLLQFVQRWAAAADATADAF